MAIGRRYFFVTDSMFCMMTHLCLAVSSLVKSAPIEPLVEAMEVNCRLALPISLYFSSINLRLVSSARDQSQLHRHKSLEEGSNGCYAGRKFGADSRV